MFESYSAEARRAVSIATGEARRFRHPQVGTEHLLLGLLADGDTRAATALRTAGTRVTAARHKVAEAAGSASETIPEGELPHSPRAQRALERAGRFARHERAPSVGTTHLLLGVLDVEGLACQVLRGLGVDLGRLRDDLVERPADEAAETAPAERAATVPPRCAACSAPLVDALTITRVDAAHELGTTPVGVVHCASCGTAIGVMSVRT